MMDAHIRTLLEKLAEEGRLNDAREQDRSKKMLNLEPETAQLLSILVRSSKCTRLLEIGTSNGYSTIWLAWASHLVGGRVISIDRNERKHVLADANLRQIGLRESVDLISGDATKIIADLPGPFDFVFFDADRRSAPSQLSVLVPKLAPEVFILADNALSHPDEIAEYLAVINTLPDFEHIIIPVGKGLSIAYRGAPHQSSQIFDQPERWGCKGLASPFSLTSRLRKHLRRLACVLCGGWHVDGRSPSTCQPPHKTGGRSGALLRAVTPGS
ncbi:MAG: class I SAM-dependent methyltransferase [Chloroflexi bacterium]|nr:class I SAM-dependent methyltransferase [Chloroflexota bacterium]